MSKTPHQRKLLTSMMSLFASATSRIGTTWRAVSPLFANAGQSTAAYDPRQLQFGMKLH